MPPISTLTALVALLTIGAPLAPRPAGAQANDTRPAPGDVAFVQGMISHHAQAVEMAALIAQRSTRREMLLLGERITVSQRDEIAMMRQWLRDHGVTAPDSGANAHAAHAMSMTDEHGGRMPGMLTREQMASLAAASGDAFDRLFLEGMIQHHQGALTMVRDLLRQPGAARQPQLYEFAADIDADQRAEIARMTKLLATIPAR